MHKTAFSQVFKQEVIFHACIYFNQYIICLREKRTRVWYNPTSTLYTFSEIMSPVIKMFESSA